MSLNESNKEQAEAFLKDPAQFENMLILARALKMKYKVLCKAGFNEQQSLYIVAHQGINWGIEE